uniref:Uncharacterized protein n=1 Tax=Chromera velia CCMP2878 TaxID=1169474 RepID=A0A0G4GM58_9ALVE|eukprot:Cvel_22515.t1-p1 / transcript=Cvel_22515.t1 / gene=Cvel_22515 / organism=Chromera_velia_CCMP2878 / gene_product=hypothetical protein / transcript_product=hypothetical protein / location=Cvel_scaffold2220:25492-26868(+) / protein_length=396 / sequence_SO=supercontig / SO=protein_coding / is_pseudo=false
MKSFFRGLLNDALEPISTEVSRLSAEFDRRDAVPPGQQEERVEDSLNRWIPSSRTSAAVAEKKERISPVSLFAPGAVQAQKVRKPFDAVAFFSDKDPSPSHSNSSDRKHFRSTEEWRSNIIVALNKAGSDARAFRRDVRRWRRKRVNPEDIVKKMKQEYSSTLLGMQLAVQERVQVFPWLLDHRDRNGRVVIPSGVVLSFAKIDQRLKDLLLDFDDAEWEIADPAKVTMIVNALTDNQRMKLVNSLRSKLPGLGGQLDLRQIDYATLKKELEWFASFDRDAEIKARQRQSGGRERAFRGQQRRGRESGGFRNQRNRQNGQRSSQQSPLQQQQQPWGLKRCWWCQDMSHFEKNCVRKRAGQPRIEPRPWVPPPPSQDPNRSQQQQSSSSSSGGQGGR